MKGLHMAAWILVIIGGLNWLLVAVVGWDISRFLGGMDSGLSRIVYLLVGLSALYELFTHKKNCKNCETKMPMA
jgi:uncharacterized membrane protein YuzA (DUF378 family)